MGPDRIRAYLAGDLPTRLAALIEEDLKAGDELAALQDLEHLLLLQRWCLDLCNNFVNFSHLYNPAHRALFETGSLVMDGHVFHTNLRVASVDLHAPVAERSGIYLLYSEVTGAAGELSFFIVTPITKGRIANLGIGKRGVLFDPSGRELDARVVKVVENPVNLRQAIAAPFKRLGNQISATAERITSSAEKQLQARITEATSAVETGVQQGIASSGAEALPSEEAAPAAPASPAGPASSGGIGGLRDIVLAGGVAVAALGSAFAYIARTLAETNVQWWHIPIALAVGLTLVIVPTVIVAFFRLRARNLSALLEASGWAINARMRLTRRLADLMVQRPLHPKSYRRLPKDLTRTFVRALRREPRTGAK